jgi:hypothetical protein
MNYANGTLVEQARRETEVSGVKAILAEVAVKDKVHPRTRHDGPERE